MILNTNIVHSDREIQSDPKLGYVTTDTWVGTYEACIGKMMTFDRSRYSMKITPATKPAFSLTVTRPFLDDGNNAPEAPQETWELIGNTVQTDILSAPKSIALGSVMIATIKQEKRKIEKANAADIPAAYKEAVDQLGFTAQAQTVALGRPVSRYDAADLLDLLIAGTTVRHVSEYVLKHTRTLGKNSDQRPSFENVGSVYWKPQHFSGIEALPQNILFDIFRIPASVIPTGLTELYTWGFLKDAPQVKEVGGGKWEIVSEWKLNQWTTYLYPRLAPSYLGVGTFIPVNP